MRVSRYLHVIYIGILFQSQFSAVRQYGGGAPLTLDLIESRVILTLQLYDKINPEQVDLIQNIDSSDKMPFIGLSYSNFIIVDV